MIKLFYAISPEVQELSAREDLLYLKKSSPRGLSEIFEAAGFFLLLCCPEDSLN